MGWRKILEAEHRLMLEVADAADNECAHTEATGAVRADLVGDILGFFRFFCDGLHDPKEDDLLFARCHKRGMTDAGRAARADDRRARVVPRQARRARAGARAPGPERHGRPPCDFAAGCASTSRSCAATSRSRRTVFFDTAQHYLTENDRRELTEEFEAVHWDEVEEGVQAYWEELAHRLWSRRPSRPDGLDEAAAEASCPQAVSRRPRTAPSQLQAAAPSLRYSCMSSAAWRAAPMARMTVAAPVTMSPPAHTRGTLVRPDSVNVRM